MNSDRKICPYCGEEIALSAKKCRYCGEWLEESAKPMNVDPEIKTGINHVQQITEGAKSSDLCSRVDNANAADKPKYVMVDVPKGFFETYFWDSLIKKYASFSGLSSRKEFWLTQVAFSVIVYVGMFGFVMLIAGIGGEGGFLAASIVLCLVMLALYVPMLAICCRRLRDAGLSPWLILISLVPGLGALALIIMYCLPSKNTHTHKWVHFGPLDVVIVGICVLLLGIGAWSMLRSQPISEYPNASINNQYEGTEYEGSQTSLIKIPIKISSPNAFQGYQHEFTGKIGTSSRINMQLDLENYTGYYYYLDDSDNSYPKLQIISYDPEETTIKILETNESGETTGIFQGYLSEIGELYGSYINEYGEESTFYVEVNDAP